MSVDDELTKLLSGYPSLLKIVAAQIEQTPRHKDFLRHRFLAAVANELALCERLARSVLVLAGSNLHDYLKAYDFITRVSLEEEIFFRRNDRYRLTSFAEANREVYSNRPFMREYMRGLLLSQIYWSNHTRSMDFFESSFLPLLSQGSALLEIGPGHGFFMASALARNCLGVVSGWDISEASLEETNAALASLGYRSGFSLALRDIFAPGPEKFDAVVMSEVLEHLEEPDLALKAVHALLPRGGRLFVNIPINSPMPDHIYLLRSQAEATALVEGAAFKIDKAALFPGANYSLERALKHSITVSVCMIATAL
ncbi:hypothetical protein U91I_01576 [alpha proteobacterium U9-1i]|nr:hypothetical protein U91I_01576 [alpha proteobacterium U9-1i]